MQPVVAFVLVASWVATAQGQSRAMGTASQVDQSATAAAAWRASASPSEDIPVGTFVSVSWRGLALAKHLSHGPAFSAGATFQNGLFRVGLAGFGRPGPINPRTFSVQSANGTDYKDASTLTLRSDGGFVGVHMALAFDLPEARWLSVVLPVTVGQAAFGYYLFGDDRDTPDGRPVSAWENELLDARDSSASLGVEVGLQLGVNLPSQSWLRPFISVHYLWTPGYDAYVSSSYAGPSVSLGLELGYGL